MDTYLLIKDLTTWIENNLESPISINSISDKSGYSKWHIQRMFKHTTGKCLGEYVRSRRLSKSALELRLTSREIIDIALQYHFTSQQTFTRAFKREFGTPPLKYRNSNSWLIQDFTSPVFFEPKQVGEFVFLSTTKLTGNESRFYCNESICYEKRYKHCMRIFNEFIINNNLPPEKIFGLYSSHIFNKKKGLHDGCFFLGVQDLPNNNYYKSCIYLKGGRYVKFHYIGKVHGLVDFWKDIYEVKFPFMKVNRRPGYDIEVFYSRKITGNILEPDEIYLEYFIPISD